MIPSPDAGTKCGFLPAARIAASFLLTTTSLVEAEEAENNLDPGYSEGVNRVDLTYTRRDSVFGETDVVLLGYTRTFGADIRLGIEAGGVYLDKSEVSEGEDGTSPTDTLFVLQYDVSERLTASPWIPNTLGITASLSAPTGDPGRGIGSDSWIGSIGGGTAIKILGDLWIIPAASYEKSFSEGDLAIPIEQINGSLGLTYVLPNGFWFNYTPKFVWDREIEETYDDHFFSIGKMFRNGLGFGFEYGQIDQVLVSDDDSILLNLYYQFGK